MPLIKNTDFKPNYILRNKHVNTIYRHYADNRKVSYQRERMFTRDGDFLDLDKSSVNSDKLILAVHGLEGSSESNYIRSLVCEANIKNFDVIVLNLRSCSGVPNKMLKSYHSGKTEDLFEALQYINQNYSYNEITIASYSLGGNLTLKFMGEYADNMPVNIKRAVAVSAPCHLKGSALKLSQGFNKIYQNRFLKSLKEKARKKFLQFPNHTLNETAILKSKTFQDFDNWFTAAANGFINADDYWEKSSSKPFLKYINKPVLLISALNDPFLSAACFPFEEAEKSSYFYFLPVKYGGHVGFYQSFNPKKNLWLENTIMEFINKN